MQKNKVIRGTLHFADFMIQLKYRLNFNKLVLGDLYMNLIKKIIACGLAVSVALGGVYAHPTNLESEKQDYSSISPNVKKGIIAGASALGGVGLLACVGYGLWNCCFSWPVVVIGGEEATRKQLIDKLKDKETKYHHSQGRDHLSLRSAVERRKKEDSRITKARAKSWNWEISDFNVDDPSAESKLKDAKLVIAVLTDEDSAKRIDELVGDGKIPADCKVVSFVAETYKPVAHLCGGGDEGNEASKKMEFNNLTELFRHITDNNEDPDQPAPKNDKTALDCAFIYGGVAADCCISAPERLLLQMRFYWNKDTDTFVRFIRCTPEAQD